MIAEGVLDLERESTRNWWIEGSGSRRDTLGRASLDASHSPYMNHRGTLLTSRSGKISKVYEWL